jgi:hypothetical protein
MTSQQDNANPLPKRRPNLNAEEKSEIARLREKGWGLERLAEKFASRVGSISWCCLMAGVSPPGADRCKSSQNAFLEPEYTRNGKPVRRFLPDEDRLIKEMRESGATIADICRATKRRHNSIVGRLAALAKQEEKKGETMPDIGAVSCSVCGQEWPLRSRFGVSFNQPQEALSPLSVYPEIDYNH